MKKYNFITAGAIVVMLSAFIPHQGDKMTQGLKEALTVGTKNAVAAGSKADGYFKNPKIKIPFPAEVQRVEKEVRKIGMGPQADQFVLSMNRAAEGAAKDAAPIFLDAVKKMSVTDAAGILKGGDNSITKYFRSKTDAQLVQKFTPVISKSLGNVKAAQLWGNLMGAYNKIPLVKKADLDLTSYTTRKAVDGLYILMADEEKKIRTNPAARVSDLLKDVFGNLLK